MTKERQSPESLDSPRIECACGRLLVTLERGKLVLSCPRCRAKVGIEIAALLRYLEDWLSGAELGEVIDLGDSVTTEVPGGRPASDDGVTPRVFAS